MWIRFMDMHSGGGGKIPPYNVILIEAPSTEAGETEFTRRFGRDPHNVTCSCCGADYSVSATETLEEATAFDRDWTAKSGSPTRPLADYLTDSDVLVVRASVTAEVA